MATRITTKGQVTIPKTVRQALHLSPGDSVEFQSNGSGEFVLHKAETLTRGKPPGERRKYRRVESQMRRAEQLLALLRRLD